MTTTATEGLEARDNLLTICDLWPSLRARLHRGGGSPFDVKVSGSAEPQLVLDIHILDLMSEIEQEAASLAHVLHDETVDADGRPWRTTHRGIDLLREIAVEHYGHWTAGDDRTALAFCDWAHEYAGKVRGAIERPVPPSYMGDCPKTLTAERTIAGRDYLHGDPCPGSLYLRAGRSTMRCGVCGQETTASERRTETAEIMGELVMTQAELRTALLTLGITVPWSTLNTWVRRGRLEPAWEQTDGTPVYLARDAIALGEELVRRRAEIQAARDNLRSA